MAHGHCANVFASFMMFVAALTGTIAISTTWFSDDSGNTTFSLWQMDFQLKSPLGTHKIEAKHDDQCKHSDVSDDLKEYCNKIKATRGLTIGTAVLGMLGTVALACEYCTHRMWLLVCSVILVVLTFGSAGAAVYLGVELANDNRLLEKPDVGFIMICVATLMAGMALVMTMVAACCGPASDEGGFKQFGGEGKMDYGNRPPVGGTISGYGSQRPQPAAQPVAPPVAKPVAPPPANVGQSPPQYVPQQQPLALAPRPQPVPAQQPAATIHVNITAQPGSASGSMQAFNSQPGFPPPQSMATFSSSGRDDFGIQRGQGPSTWRAMPPLRNAE